MGPGFKVLSEEHIPAPSTKSAPEHQVADTNTEQVKDAAEVKDF